MDQVFTAGPVFGAPVPPQLPVDITAFLHNPDIIGIGNPKPWYKVSDPTHPPNNAVGTVGRPNAVATGFQISDRHVITSAHALAEPEDYPPASKTPFTYRPAGGDPIAVCAYAVPNLYTAAYQNPEYGDWEGWDFAVLTLEEPSPVPFWFGFAAGSDALWDGAGGRFIYLRGFPASDASCGLPNSFGQMWGSGFSANRFLSNVPLYFPTAAPGTSRMSGSPAFVMMYGSAIAIGVVRAHTTIDGQCRAWVTRFGADSINEILVGRKAC